MQYIPCCLVVIALKRRRDYAVNFHGKHFFLNNNFINVRFKERLGKIRRVLW